LTTLGLGSDFGVLGGVVGSNLGFAGRRLIAVKYVEHVLFRFLTLSKHYKPFGAVVLLDLVALRTVIAADVEGTGAFSLFLSLSGFLAVVLI